MKQGLSLRMSQHLALTPQLQQSIRLLQLSTLELSQEVEQMLDENPFLERAAEESMAEEFGLPEADTRVSLGDRVTEAATEARDNSNEASAETTATVATDEAVQDVAESWEGDGSADVAPDDSEWGNDASSRKTSDSDAPDAIDLARGLGSFTEFLHRQALSLRLSEVDRAALRYLIESLNDDGYLEDSLESLAQGLAGTDDLEQLEELVHRFTVALSLLQSLEPVGVGARGLAECLRLQIKAQLQDDPDHRTWQAALKICAQPLELLAKRDVKRLLVLCGEDDVTIKSAIALIARLEPKPARPFANAEQHVIIPDVLVTNTRPNGEPRFKVQLNPDVLPRLRWHDI